MSEHEEAANQLLDSVKAFVIEVRDRLARLENCLFYLKGLHPELGMRDQDQAIINKLAELSKDK